MGTSKSVLLALYLILTTVNSTLSVCNEANSTLINDHHPNKNNNWEEHKGWNSTVVDNFCSQADHGIQGIVCLDEKNESLSMSSHWVNTTEYSALCDIHAGLVCRPNKSHCPDYKIQYACKCPNISTTTMTSSTTTTPTVTLSTKTSGTNTSTMTQSSRRQSGQTNDDHTGDDGLPLARIIGIGVGGLLLLVVSCLLVVYCIKKKQKEKVHIVKELRI